MQNLIQRSLALFLALGTLSIATTTIYAAPSLQDDEGSGVIEGYVFLDDDGDGTLDLDEPGIGSITVRLEGEVEREVETDVAGGYGFFDLPDGDYEVIVEPGDDYATAELDRDEVSIEGEQVRRLDFALAEVDDEADADDEDEDAADEDMDEDDSDMDDADEDDADDEAMDDDDAMDDDSDMHDDEADDADDMAAESDATEMSVVVQQLIDAMGEDASEAEIRMALESALASARVDGTENELSEAIEMALDDMDEDESAADDADADDEDMDDADDSDMDDEDMADEADEADDGMAGDATGGAMTKGGKPVYPGHEPEDMPNAGAGGPMSFGLILVLLLAGLAFVGRGMERRQQV